MKFPLSMILSASGHTLTIAGYIADEDLYILCNPAISTPGLQLISAADLNSHFTYLKETNWNQDNLLLGENNLGALTFCEVPIGKALTEATAPPLKKS